MLAGKTIGGSYSIKPNGNSLVHRRIFIDSGIIPYFHVYCYYFNFYSCTYKNVFKSRKGQNSCSWIKKKKV